MENIHNGNHGTAIIPRTSNTTYSILQTPYGIRQSPIDWFTRLLHRLRRQEFRIRLVAPGTFIPTPANNHQPPDPTSVVDFWLDEIDESELPPLIVVPY